MKNKYGLPEEDLEKIRKRDKDCVYCHKIMTKAGSGGFRGDWATIEHLNHLPPWDNPSTVAICCGSCNSSRGAKTLPNWFKTSYCIEKNINIDTVSSPVRNYIQRNIEGKWI
jgi:hypothetical protein